MATGSSFLSVFLHLGMLLVLALCFLSANTAASDESFPGAGVSLKDGEAGTAITNEDKYEEEKYPHPVLKKPFWKKPWAPKVPIWKKPLPIKVPVIEKPDTVKGMPHAIPIVKKPFVTKPELKKPLPILKKPFPPKV